MFPRSDARLCGWRTVAAFAILPPLDAVLGYLLFPLMWWLTDRDGYALRSSPDVAARFAAISAVAGLLVTIGGAVPLVLWLAHRRQLSLRHAALSGLLLGNAPFGAYLVLVVSVTIGHLIAGTLGDHLMPFASLIVAGVRVIAVGSTIGLLSALVFWVIGVRDERGRNFERSV